MNSANIDILKEGGSTIRETRARIGVAPARELEARKGLFALLGQLYSVDFETCSADETPQYDGLILWDDPECEIDFAAITPNSMECLIFASREGRNVSVQSGCVKFSDSGFLDKAFRRSTMIEKGITAFTALGLRGTDEVVCSLESEPYWILRSFGQTPVSVVALSPGELGGRETIYSCFNRQRWLQLLPLLHFLKRISQRNGWEPPAFRACLMFDDPNLHWMSYGFINLPQMAQHARSLAYHVAFAMVPLDTWYANPGVVQFVKQNRNEVSLCMHGNNHTQIELGASMDQTTLTRLLAQALQRVSGFERRTGVPVARVMVPPYGAFKENAAKPMLNLGYEAVCVSRASLTAWNKEKIWSSSFGHALAEVLDGLPVIPRHVMAPGHEGSYRLAAFLDQPIIPHGHHQDCAGGLGLLEEVSASINGLGKVAWMDMTAISRSSYMSKREGQLLKVKMLTRRVDVPLPEWATGIIVERPWMGEDHCEPLFIRQHGDDRCSGIFGRLSSELPVPFPGTIEVASPAANPRRFWEVKPPPLKLKAIARRVLAETRDRVAPLLSTARSQ